MMAGPKISVTAYDSEALRALQPTACQPPDVVTAERVCLLGLLRRRRGCRAHKLWSCWPGHPDSPSEVNALQLPGRKWGQHYCRKRAAYAPPTVCSG